MRTRKWLRIATAGGVALAGLTAGVLAPCAAAAQSVRGTVVGTSGPRPLSGTGVRLLDSTAGEVDRAVTDGDGGFVLDAPGPGRYLVHVAPTGYLSYSQAVELAAGDTLDLRIEMPVVSEAAAAVMREVIDREAAFQLPWEELCGEPVRPWEAGVLVGVARDRRTMEAVPRTVVRVEPVGDAEADASTRPDADAPAGSGGDWPRTRVATETGAFWFCNVPPGRVRVTARAAGFSPDTWEATIRPGTISWYDALLRR